MHWLFTALLCLVTSAVQATAYYQNEVFKHGAVMARAVVLDDQGQPILVEYNTDGSEAGVVAIPSDYQNRIRELQVISAYEYHSQKLRLEAYLQHHKDDLALGAQLLPRAQFLGQTYPLANGQGSITPPTPPAHVKSVLIRGRSNRIINDPSQLILLSFTIDLAQSYSVPQSGSVVINPQGQIIASSTLNIGPRAGFYGDPNQAQGLALGPTRGADDQIFGPVPYTKVFVDEWVFPGGVDVTDNEGKYRLSFRLPPCPGFSFEYTTDVMAELRYANFSPTGAPVLPYYLRRQDWSWCHGVALSSYTIGGATAYIDAVATLSTMSAPNYAIDLKVDVMFLTGLIQMQNPDGTPIAIGDVTEYAIEAPDTNPITQQYYDFDGDGRPDHSVLGNMVEQTQSDGTTQSVFVEDPNGTLQGVYFSSRANQTGQPDVIRLADTAKNLGSNGLLKTISEDDLKNTDVLVFRESTGQLVLERKGLRDAEIAGRAQMGMGTADNVFYRIMLRGPMDTNLNVGATHRSGTWTDWSTRNQLTEPFRARESDHLKPGEWIRLVAINRATGYIGTQRIQLSDASTNAGGYLNVPVNDTVMRPPNLKIWAERTYDVQQGLTAGEERRFIIGAEGASLASDAMIQVYSEWYDHDGRPLPEGLGADNGEQYGLTGRLAKVIAANTLAEVAHGQLANFPISPGRQTQVLRIRDNLTAPEHFYIHVSGTQKDSSPQFDAGGLGVQELMSARPRVLTPFLTPLYDENTGWQTYNAYRGLLRDQEEAEASELTITPLRPLPSYVWAYRPEYQFSQYDLEVAEITRVIEDEGGALYRDNIIDLRNPLISSGDELIEIFYSLLGNNFDRLGPVDGPQDLILALGEQEIKLTLGEHGQITFDNLEHLASLNPADFVTLRLYTNQDAGNILWEYTFGTFALIADMDRNGAIESTGKDRLNTEQYPFLFWINDDSDDNYGEIADGKKLGLNDIPGVTDSPNYQDGMVNGMRDLVDFFPVHVDIKGVLASFPPTRYEYILKHADGGLKFFEGEGMLAGGGVSDQGVDALIKNAELARMLQQRPLTSITQEGVSLGFFFLDAIAKNYGGGVIFIESGKAVASSKLELEIVESATRKPVGSTELWLSTSGVEDMYRHLNLRSIINKGDDEGMATNPSEPSNNPDHRTDDKYFVFTHGYNVSAEKARGWNAQIFKRLYRLGFNGRYIGVTWAGDTGIDYHAAVFNAMKTSKEYKDGLVAIAQNRPVTIAAHSLGNMVVSNAIEQHGLVPQAYFMINAAVAIEAYDSVQMFGDATMQRNMTEADWYDYPRELYAANWHEVFTASDPRNKITWKDRFSSVIPYAYNFYSPGDDVVENATPNERFGTHVWEKLTGGDFGRHAWVAQEIVKGGKFILACNSLAFSRCQSGWQFNNFQGDLEYIGKWLYRDDYTGDAFRALDAHEATEALANDSITNEHIAQFGYFRRFELEFRGLYAPIVEGNGLREGVNLSIEAAHEEAAKLETQWRVLGHAIPAQSYAVAVNPLDRLRVTLEREERNFDMQQLRDDASLGWPQERLDDETLRDDWLHSDFRNVAMPYVYPVFQKMLEKGSFIEVSRP